ncbi:hypothetical protein [Bordetella sp. 15P40C-2]|uniref:hypothetical protein n=1 Tax=Bordetella sp. 15P40C-2 TaxID=2572246 RepID=UPI0013276595|nr:hypothetical protein [Bordetella sp. 15P40C-2]MVW72881.1 hypothetical protein [Bordetella sp. 15P40C-2]
MENVNAVNAAATARLVGWQADRAKERGAEKLSCVLEWVYRWGYASASTLVLASGAQDRSYTQRLVRKGLIRPVPTTRCPTTREIYVLSRAGLDQARAAYSEYIDYPELDTRRINQANVRHNLLAQREVLARLPAYQGWMSDRDFGQNLADSKRPDGGLVDDQGRITGLEIELSGKWARRLDQLSIRIVASLAQEKLSKFIVLCATEAMAARYRGALRDGHEIQKWEQVGESKFVKRGKWPPIPPEIAGKINIEVLAT